MLGLSRQHRLDIGMHAAATSMLRQDKIWARHSNDKVDVGQGLAEVVRTLMHDLPPERPLGAVSLGSSSEPQFRMLGSIFRAGLWLVDIEQAAIDVIEERTIRQRIDHVRPVRGDYRMLVGTPDAARGFVRSYLGGHRVELVTLHHSLYYAQRESWRELFAALCGEVLSDRPGRHGACGAVHAVLMATRSDDPTSATWLYNHFAGRFFGASNDQDLPDFAVELRADPRFAGARIMTRSSPVSFWCDDFERLMHGVWMVLLHPAVHCFDEAQQSEVIEHVYQTMYLPGAPLTQVQDHLCVYKRAPRTGQLPRRARADLALADIV